MNRYVAPGVTTYAVSKGQRVRVVAVVRPLSQVDDTIVGDLARFGFEDLLLGVSQDWPQEPQFPPLASDERFFRFEGTWRQNYELPTATNTGVIFYAVWVYVSDATAISPAPPNLPPPPAPPGPPILPPPLPPFNIYDSPSKGGPDLDDAFWPALQTMAEKTYNVPAEWLLRIFYLESTLNPHIGNALGYVGLNQISGKYLQDGFKVSPADYLTWSASRQIQQVIGIWYTNTVRDYLGRRPRSVGALYALNIGPGVVKAKGDGPGVVIYASPDIRYQKNAGLDYDKSGEITIQDFDNFLDNQIAKRAPYIEQAKKLGGIAPTPTIEDSRWNPLLVGGVMLGVTGLLAYALRNYRHA